jgi:diguanylate cyclase (GGDEF)-like protein/PAS domain S-box-containing protein
VEVVWPGAVDARRRLVAGGLVAAGAFGLAAWQGRWSRADLRRRLRASEEQARMVFDVSPIGMALLSLDGRFIRVNRAMGRSVGYTEGELVGRTFETVRHEADRAPDDDQVERCLAGEIDGYEIERRYRHRDGHEVFARLNVVLVRDGAGEPSHFLVQMLDVSDERAAAASLAASEARFTAMVEHGCDLIAIIDGGGELVYASPAYRTVLGYDPATLTGRPLHEDVHPDDVDGVVELGARLTGTPGGSVAAQFRFRHADGSWRWVEATMTNRLDDPAVAGFVINTRDVTDRVLALELAAHRAAHDALTGLPNRALLEDRMTQAEGAATRQGEQLAVLYVDVDHFKDVNDTFGHRTGDLVLTEVADRLRRAARDADTVARLGGDEFVVAGTVGHPTAAQALAARICAAFSEPFGVHEWARVPLTVSVGVATSGQYTGRLGLLDAADLALYEAKSQGRDRWVAFRPEMEQAARVGHRTA